MATKKKKPQKPQAIVNRRASFDYALGDEITAGVVLNGREVRAARDGRVQLKGSFVTIRNNELWLNNASFSLKLNTKGVNDATVDTTPRKLLASRKQIDQLAASKQAGMSIVPLRLLTRGRFIKLVIALGKGKKHYDKRQAIKKRDQERDAGRNL
ncbi:MAG TPA: SsrA-binding protein SmpB [Dongiaceae bacterium]|nr:SsrA-binding protein SmpB [Dongiaceae bacterium]